MSEIVCVRAAVGAALVVLGSALSAQADLVPVFLGTSPSGGATAFSYEIVFDDEGGTEVLRAGDFVTFYDLPGLVSVLTTSPDFDADFSFVGPTPPGVVVTDAPDILNAVFTYEGADATSGSTYIDFIIGSTNSATATGTFSSQTGNGAGGTLGISGPITVPAVPEPTSLAMLGLAGLFGLRRRR